ncbi:MAG TPA: ABC transporter ATP-binding protein [Terriglobales bacterium]|nr:ABC transporter ATP-binding protein [Terriglobales bacterium]
MTQLLELTGVVKVYGGAERPALDRVSLAVPAGAVAAVMGPSGSGKSTLLNLVAGLDRPTSGSVRVDGVELTRLGEAALARYRRTTVGLVFQFFNLLNNLTVLDNVAVPAELAGVRRGVARRRASVLLEELGLAEHARAFPARLSGGQRQRVAVARALVNRPPLLLADEPTGALDSRSGEQVVDLLVRLNRAGQTILLVTHDARLAERCASRIVTLVDGAVARDGALVAV